MRRRYFGAKTRVWTEWYNPQQAWCDSNGVAWQTDCDGTISTAYYQQERYFQFADGTGRTATEYRAGDWWFTQEMDGYCGYVAPRIELVYYGFAPDDNRGWRVCYPEAYSSGLTGSIWMGSDSTRWYTSPTGSEHAPCGYVLVEDRGTWETSSYQRVYQFSE